MGYTISEELAPSMENYNHQNNVKSFDKEHLKEGKKYFMVVQVTAAGNETYKSKSVKVQLRIKIH